MSEMVFCRGCGKEIHQTAVACPHCGAQQATGTGKSKTTAALLAFFLGGFGVHRFYLGKWWGVFYLLFFWTLIPGLIATVEAIVFACTDDRKWDEKYNEGRPSGGSSGGLIVVVAVIAGFFMIAIVGILAAIALPAYQDYTARAKLAEVAVEGDRIAMVMNEYNSSRHAIPADAAALGVPVASKFVRAVEIDQKTGIVSMELNFAPLLGRHFMLIPSSDETNKLLWKCGSTDIKQNLLPSKCRQKLDDGTRQ